MNKKQFIDIIDEKLKLVRTEYALTQEKMAEIIGVSKKTLVEVEKNRKSLGWTNSVALASVFSDSTILNQTFGGNISEIIIAVALKNVEVDYPKTAGGKFWWETRYEKNGYRIQQNMFSRHFRLLDHEDRRIYVSYNLEDAEIILNEILKTIL